MIYISDWSEDEITAQYLDRFKKIENWCESCEKHTNSDGICETCEDTKDRGDE